MGKDTFMINITRKGFVTGSEVKAEAITEANEFCAKQNKKLQIVNADQSDMKPFRADAYAEIQFMCLDENDPELSRPKLNKMPDPVVKIEKEGLTKEQSAMQKDIYSELIKLNDLRTKGIISDVEFETQKKKILNSIP